MLAMPGKSRESRAIFWLISPDPDHLRIGPPDAQKGLSNSAHQRLQQPDRILPDRPGDSEKLKDIDAALAALVLGYEGLMLSKPFGQLLLCETGVLACFNQQLAKGSLARRMDGLSDSARARGHRRGRLIRTSDYLKTGYWVETEVCLSLC
jgi:hypothetical protein